MQFFIARSLITGVDFWPSWTLRFPVSIDFSSSRHFIQTHKICGPLWLFFSISTIFKAHIRYRMHRCFILLGCGKILYYTGILLLKSIHCLMGIWIVSLSTVRNYVSVCAFVQRHAFISLEDFEHILEKVICWSFGNSLFSVTKTQLVF